MSRKRLIINADGYGFTAGVTRGIEEAIERGVVTSTSVNSNFESVWPLKDFIQRNPRVSVGVHLNPMVGKPIADPKDVPSLVNEKGEFHYQSFITKLQSGHIDLDELALELGLQIERVQKLVPTVTHLDSHQNKHVYPKFFKVFLALARKHGISRMRAHIHFLCPEYPNRRTMTLWYYVRRPHRVLIHWYARHEAAAARRAGMRMCDRTLTIGAFDRSAVRPSIGLWEQVARACPPGDNETYCHPGYADDDLRRWATGLIEQREMELKVLTDPRLPEVFERHGVELISFYDL